MVWVVDLVVQQLLIYYLFFSLLLNLEQRSNQDIKRLNHSNLSLETLLLHIRSFLKLYSTSRMTK